MKSLLLSAVMMLSGGLLLVFPSDGVIDDIVIKDNPLTECYKADTASKISVLKEWEEKDMDWKDPKSLPWMRDKLHENYVEDMKPFVAAVTDAISTDKVPELIKVLENK